MFEDYYYDNPQLQGLLAAAAGGPIMDAPRQPAVMPTTQQAVAPLSYEALADRRAAANTPPPGTSIVGPTAGEDPLAFGTGNTFSVGQGQEVRLVDAGGNVIVSGSGVEGANRAVAAAQSLSDELGGAANFKIQTGERTINPDGTVGETRYVDVARAAPSQSGLGFLADNVLPFAASFIPGIGPIAGAALGSAVSSGLQGRSLKDALTRAAIAGGSAYAGGQLFGPATPGASAPMTGVNADLIPNALQGLNFGSLTSAAIPAAVGGAAGDILVNAATKAAASAVPSILASTAGNVIGQAALSQAGTPNQRNTDAGTDSNDGYVDPETGDIVVSKYRPISPPGGYAPIPILGAGLGAGSILDSLGPLNPPPADPALMQPETLPEDIVVTATPETGLPVGSILAQLPMLGLPTPDPALTENKFNFKDVLGTGLTVPQLLSIGGVGADLLQSLLAGGGGGTGTGSPYVSQFGTGAGFAPRQDMRANPNILDYERYGFGPEAMFFKPEYSGLLPANAPAQAPQAMTINPAYMPLI
jgi:hypothetical protein